MGTSEDCIERLDRVKTIVDGIRATYPDAKKISVDIHFEWVETEFYSDGADLCPIVKVYIER